MGLRERSEPGALAAPTTAQAVAVGPHGIDALEGGKDDGQ